MSEKIKTPRCTAVREKFDQCSHLNIVVFGASNTERYMPSIHWSDVLDLGLRNHFGRKFHMINSGVCGNNTRDGLARFDRDIASFSPDIVFITLGGNDCNPHPLKHVQTEEFAANLDLIISRVRALGALPVLQTYYEMDKAHMEQERAVLVDIYMEEIRKVSERNGVFLIDLQKYFLALPENTLRYKLLLNPMHVNEQGNIFIGVVLLHHLGIDPLGIEHNEKFLAAEELFRSIAE